MEAVRTSKVYARDVTSLSPTILALFSSHFTAYEGQGVIVIDGWLRFKTSSALCKAIQNLRNTVDDAFLERALNPVIEDDEKWLTTLSAIVSIVRGGSV